MYKKLCQYYYGIDKEATLKYIESYNSFFDDEDALDINVILSEMKADKSRSLDEMGIIIRKAEIDNMFVENEYRGMNIGTMFINKFKEYCIEKGINTFKVNASAPNTKAIEFYKKNGFTEHDITFWCKA